jgi:hypothetical protein
MVMRFSRRLNLSTGIIPNPTSALQRRKKAKMGDWWGKSSIISRRGFGKLKNSD